VIDRQTTIMGSYNLSAGAARNSEDLNVLTSSQVASAYGKHWQARQGVSIRFGGASERCGR
jgi:phosphatidylserine/phosphatidylglycerophosphate/cardiolipin synthase-like enzyme